MNRHCKSRQRIQRGGCVPGRRSIGVISQATEAPRVKFVPKRRREEDMSDEDMEVASELRTKLAKLDNFSDPAAILKKKAMRSGGRMMCKKRRGMRGKGKVLDFFKKNIPKVNDFLRKTKALSKIGRFAEGLVPPQYRGAVGTVSGGLEKLGYGYPRRGRRGGALRLAGMR